MSAKIMKKDFLIALVLGFGVGLIIAVSVIYAPQILSFRPSLSFLNNNNKSDSTNVPTPIPDKKVLGLTISSPKNESILTGDSVDIEGIAQETAIIILSTNTEDKIITPNDKGEFTANIDILEGSNLIYITSYINGQLSEEKMIEVFKTEQDL